MALKCKGVDGKNLFVKMMLIKDAWVPVISVCNQRLYKITVVPSVVAVTGISVSSSGPFITISWNLSKYTMTGQIKVNDGDWVDWGVSVPSSDNQVTINSRQFEAIAGDLVQIRLRFTDGVDFSHHYTSDQITISFFKLLIGGNTTPNLTNFTSNWVADESVVYQLEGNDITVNDPTLITEIRVGFYSMSGEINISQCSNLIYFRCSGNNFTLINANGCSNLETLLCNINHNLVSLILDGCTNLNTLTCSATALSSLDISETNISYLNCANVSNLQYVESHSGFGSVDGTYVVLSSCGLSVDSINDLINDIVPTVDSNLFIDSNPGSSNCNFTIALDKGWSVTGGPAKIFFGSEVPALADFVNGSVGDVRYTLYGNDIYLNNIDKLVSLDLSNSNIQGRLYLISQNQSASLFVTLNLSNCSGLTSFGLNQTNVNSLNVSGCVGLTELDCSQNKLTTFSMLNNTSIDSIYCDNPNITNINVSGCLMLATLRCNSSPLLSSYNITGCNISDISFQNTGLTSAHFTSCVDVNIQGSPIESFIANNCGINRVNIASAVLSSLSLTNDSNLHFININNSLLTASQLNDIFTSLPTRSGDGEIDLMYSTGADTCDASIAENKGWTVNK